MSSRAIRTLYRLCLRQAADLQRIGLQLEFRKPIDKQAYVLGNSSIRWLRPSPAYNIDAFRSLLPWAAQGIEKGSFAPDELKDLIRQQFRHPVAVDNEAEFIDRAITSLRVLSEQLYMAQCTGCSQSEGVVVEVTAAYVGQESDFDPTYETDDDSHDQRLYTYRVRIANTSDKTIQVLARHWVITDSKGKTVEIRKWSPGVVGARPVLEPQDCFEYYSSTSLETREGTMRGAFQIGELDIEARRRDPVRLFEVEVPSFPLQPPRQ